MPRLRGFTGALLITLITMVTVMVWMEVVFRCAITPGSGYELIDGDYDDGDTAKSPDAIDICDNGIDDNCNGMIDDPGIAKRFDGSNDYIISNYYLPQYSSYTNEAWVYPSSSNAYQSIILSNSNAMWLVNMRPAIGDINSWYQIQDPKPLPLNQWSHIASTL